MNKSFKLKLSGSREIRPHFDLMLRVLNDPRGWGVPFEEAEEEVDAVITWKTNAEIVKE